MSVTINANLSLNQASVKKASKQVQSALNSVNINPNSLDKFGGALGRITGNASEFQKSMEAATARVFAFGATAAVIQSINQSFKALVSTTIEVEKRLVEINTIFGASEQTFSRFRESIFQVAKNTGQAFDVVAEGAAELARQGLSAEETAKRLNAALVLTRVSGLDSVSSVNALTAAINGFTSASLDATTIVNKLVAVDTAFAVSAKDLADGFQRAGSTAEDAGVSFDELLGIITAVQQTTSRGGAVIGNALKSIFTRLSRSTTISELQELGVQIDANQGGIEKLKALSAALENVSDPTVASQIKELAGGVFQINVVSAALKDLSNESSIFAGAAAKAAGATNEAFQKNKDLNQTLSAQINSLVAGLTNLGEKIGSITLSPILGDLINIANNITDFFNDALSEENGNAFVKSFFAGIGAFIKGPGLILITGAFLNIFKLVSKFALDGFKELTRLGKGSEKIKNIEQGIIQLLVQDKGLREQLANASLSQAQKEELLIKAIRQENNLLREQQRIVTALAKAAAARGVGGFSAGGGFSGKKGKNFASGFVPSFGESLMEQSLASSHGYKAGKVKKRRMFDGQGGSFAGIYNDAESVTDVTMGGKKGTFVIPPNGFAAKGFVPNFAIRPAGSPKDFKTREEALKAGFSGAQVGRVFGPAPKKTKEKRKDPKRIIEVSGSDLGVVSLFSEAKSGTLNGTLKVSDYAKIKKRSLIKPKALNDTISMTGIQVRSLGQINKEDFAPKSVSQNIDRIFADPLEKFAKQIGDTLKISKQDYNIKGAIDKLDSQPSDLFTTGVQGQLFESAARIAATGASNAIKKFEGGASEQKPFDFEENSNALASLAEAFQFNSPLLKADAKRTADYKAANSIIRKALNDKSVRNKKPRLKSIFKASGYVPNFFNLGLNDAIKRETKGTGISPSQVRVGQDKAFAASSNPAGLAVTNTRDEPNGISDVLAASGYVPNFFAGFGLRALLAAKNVAAKSAAKGAAKGAAKKPPKLPKTGGMMDGEKPPKTGGMMEGGRGVMGMMALSQISGALTTGSDKFNDFLSGGKFSEINEELEKSQELLMEIEAQSGKGSEEYEKQSKIVQDLTKDLEAQKGASNLLGGVASGASMGMMLGPVGAAVGAIGGAVFSGAAEDRNSKTIDARIAELEKGGDLSASERAAVSMQGEGRFTNDRLGTLKDFFTGQASFAEALSAGTNLLHQVSIGRIETFFKTLEVMGTDYDKEAARLRKIELAEKIKELTEGIGDISDFIEDAARKIVTTNFSFNTTSESDLRFNESGFGGQSSKRAIADFINSTDPVFRSKSTKPSDIFAEDMTRANLKKESQQAENFQKFDTSLQRLFAKANFSTKTELDKSGNLTDGGKAEALAEQRQKDAVESANNIKELAQKLETAPASNQKLIVDDAFKEIEKLEQLDIFSEEEIESLKKNFTDFNAGNKKTLEDFIKNQVTAFNNKLKAEIAANDKFIADLNGSLEKDITSVVDFQNEGFGFTGLASQISDGDASTFLKTATSEFGLDKSQGRAASTAFQAGDKTAALRVISDAQRQQTADFLTQTNASGVSTKTFSDTQQKVFNQIANQSRGLETLSAGAQEGGILDNNSRLRINTLTDEASKATNIKEAAAVQTRIANEIDAVSSVDPTSERGKAAQNELIAGLLELSKVVQGGMSQFSDAADSAESFGAAKNKEQQANNAAAEANVGGAPDNTSRGDEITGKKDSKVGFVTEIDDQLIKAKQDQLKALQEELEKMRELDVEGAFKGVFDGLTKEFTSLSNDLKSRGEGDLSVSSDLNASVANLKGFTESLADIKIEIPEEDTSSIKEVFRGIGTSFSESITRLGQILDRNEGNPKD